MQLSPYMPISLTSDAMPLAAHQCRCAHTQTLDSSVYAIGVTARSRPRPRSSRPDKLKVVMAFNRRVYFFNLISNPHGQQHCMPSSF